MDDALITYRLKFPADKAGSQKTLEFKAADASGALIVAKNEAADRNAELWQGERLLCHLRRTEDEVWLIKP